MTRFYIKDERLDEHVFHQVTRKLYKKIITVTDKFGQLFHVGTKYVDGIPTKELTLMKRHGATGQ